MEEEEKDQETQLSLILHFSYGVRKYRVHSICFSQSFAKFRALLIAEMIDKLGEESMEAFTKKSDETEEKRH